MSVKLFLVLFLALSTLQAVPVNIVDILYRPSGNPPQVAAGTDITITQSAFTNPAGNYYPAFQLTPHPVSGSDGSINLWLEPNVSGQPYTVLYRATNGVLLSELRNRWGSLVRGRARSLQSGYNIVGAILLGCNQSQIGHWDSGPARQGAHPGCC